MKTICLIKDEKPFWKEIEEYLILVNARVFPLNEKDALQNISEKNPDIIIGGERTYEVASFISQNIIKLFVLDKDVKEDKNKNAYFLKWPVTKEAFLDMTSKLLYIYDRRFFRTIISITPKGKNETFLGRSLNFSMSGMAFNVDKPMKPGDILTISFFISSKRLKIDAEVMRSSIDPDDGSVYYGARFLNIEKDTEDVMENFIKQI